MERVILDEATLQRLAGLRKPLEFRDAAGNLLGVFRPVADLERYAGLEPGISMEELRRRENSSKWYTTAEVLERLRKLEDQ